MAACKNLVNDDLRGQRGIWKVDFLAVEVEVLVLISENERGNPGNVSHNDKGRRSGKVLENITIFLCSGLHFMVDILQSI